MNQQRLIAMAERAKNVEGSEKWPLRLASYTEYDATVFRHKDTVLMESAPIVGHGPLLHHNPLDPMNPAACLERALDKEIIGNKYISLYLMIFPKSAGLVSTYADYMEALLNLHDLAKEHGGEYQQAWERAMNPKGE